MWLTGIANIGAIHELHGLCVFVSLLLVLISIVVLLHNTIPGSSN